MARNFASANPDKLIYDNITPVNFDFGDTFSVAAWINATSGGDNAIVGHLDTGAGFKGWELHLGSTPEFFLINTYPTSALQKLFSTASPSAGTWLHLGATYDGSTNAVGINLYANGSLDNGSATQDTLGNDATTNALNLTIGARPDGSAAFNGAVAEVGVWSGVLTAAEMASLAKGFSPQLIRPSGLRFYAPLVRGQNDIRGQNGTLTGTTVVAHPRMIYPRRYK